MYVFFRFKFCTCCVAILPDCSPTFSRAPTHNMISHYKEKMFNNIFESWTKAYSTLERDQAFISNLIKTQEGKEPLSHILFKKHLCNLGHVFEQFARGLQSFQTLTPLDQNTLINFNTPLFVLYILSQFICSQKPLQQLSWLLLLPEPLELIYASQSLSNVTISELMLVKDHRRLQACCQQVHNLSPQYNCLPLVSNLMLFNSGNSPDRLEKEPIIESLFMAFFLNLRENPDFQIKYEEGKSGFNPGLTQSGAITLLSAIEEVKKFFKESSLHGWSHNLNNQPNLHYGPNEDICYHQICNQLITAYNSMPLGEDLVKECLMYSLDVPVSKNFVSRTLRICIERLYKMYALHEEIQMLTHNQYMTLWPEAYIYGLTITWVRIETSLSIQDQLTYLTGQSEKLLLSQPHFLKAIERGGNRPLRLINISQTDDIVWQKEDLESIQCLMSSLKNLTGDHVNLKLFKLVSMFCSTGADNLPTIAQLKRRYLTLLSQKARNTLGAVGDDQSKSVLLETLENVRKLSKYTKILLQAYKIV